jgi:DNA repair exonuclease SbcCD ATPase subunit
MPDDVTTKELLLELRKDMKEMRSDFNDYRILLQTHIQASVQRDQDTHNLQKDVAELKKNLAELTRNFDFFKFKVVFIASIIATGVSLFSTKIVEWIW